MINERSLTNTFQSRSEPTHLAASDARGRLRSYLDENGIDVVLADDVELAASELLSNAVEQQPAEPIQIELTINTTAIYLTVTNHRETGSPAVLPYDSAEDEKLAERGRGLTIVHKLADGMWLHGDDGSTSVSSLYKRRR